MLTVDNTIPFGNCTDVEVTDNRETAEISFSPSPHGGPEALWFCFRIKSDDKKPGKINLVLKNVGNLLGGQRPETLQPVIKKEDGDWERLQAGKRITLQDSRLNVSWTIDRPDTFVDIALCYPYGVTDVQALAKETNLTMDTIGVSQEGRPLLRLSNSYGAKDSERPGLFLMARQHSGETPGSWVLDGFIRQIASLGDKAPLMWAIPLANIDGVEQGDYGKDNFPWDLNRAWGNPPMRHETLVFQRDFMRWKELCKPFVAFDFHAPGACEDDGSYFFLPNPEKFPEHHEKATSITETLEKSAGTEFVSSEGFGRVARYPSRWNQDGFTAFCCSSGVTGYTLETPYCSSADGKVVMTREKYQELGKRLAKGTLDLIGK